MNQRCPLSCCEIPVRLMIIRSVWFTLAFTHRPAKPAGAPQHANSKHEKQVRRPLSDDVGSLLLFKAILPIYAN